MNTPLRIGIVGTSFVSDWICDAAAQTSSCEIAAIFSRDEERGKAYAAKQGISGCFCDEEAFFACPDLDAVYLASPNIAHYRQTLLALDYGKHVLCEKPLALNAAQAELMLETARDKGLILLEAIRPVYDPFLDVVRICPALDASGGRRLNFASIPRATTGLRRASGQTCSTRRWATPR
jgi:predicted dehydrogenase